MNFERRQVGDRPPLSNSMLHATSPPQTRILRHLLRFIDNYITLSHTLTSKRSVEKSDSIPRFRHGIHCRLSGQLQHDLLKRQGKSMCLPTIGTATRQLFLWFDGRGEGVAQSKVAYQNVTQAEQKFLTCFVNVTTFVASTPFF
jgi:hypothetical protein